MEPTKAQYKKLIADTFGFATQKIILLETADSWDGVYVMFEVGDIEYQYDTRANTLTICASRKVHVTINKYANAE